MKTRQLVRIAPATVAATALTCLIPSFSAAGDKIQFVSFHVPPFSIKGGERIGFVREIVRELSRRLRVPMTVRYAASAKAALKLARTQPNTMIFPLARTKKREAHFTWVVKVRDVPMFFASLPGKLKILNLSQAKQAPAIGVRLGVAVNLLKKRGFGNLAIVRTPEENARALATGRISAWYAPGPEIFYTWRSTGQRGRIVRGLTTRTIRSYIAASKSAPLVDVNKWQTAFANMAREGVVKLIIEKYLGQE